MIFLQTAIWLILVVIAASMWYSDGWAAGLFGSVFVIIQSVMFFSYLRFNLPMKWRAKNAAWDAFLCRIGSHRCIPICGARCCWVCIRCNPDDPLVKRHFDLLKRLN